MDEPLPPHVACDQHGLFPLTRRLVVCFFDRSVLFYIIRRHHCRSMIWYIICMHIIYARWWESWERPRRNVITRKLVTHAVNVAERLHKIHPLGRLRLSIRVIIRTAQTCECLSEALALRFLDPIRTVTPFVLSGNGVVIVVFSPGSADRGSSSSSSPPAQRLFRNTNLTVSSACSSMASCRFWHVRVVFVEIWKCHVTPCVCRRFVKPLDSLRSSLLTGSRCDNQPGVSFQLTFLLIA
ncbi:hypothetical protein BGW80DRAFT_640052 [Lactifluus volemus]|nr:hypothetical protein BGW80DRAFT_640052 [Lactifluus volemus]